MRVIWRTLPSLALPAVVGLGLAYLATGFLPRPAPMLRPPEELREGGQGFGQDSPVRAILERNVLHLESPPLAPLSSPIAPPVEPDAGAAAVSKPESQNSTQALAAFAAPEPLLQPKPGQPKLDVSSTLSGGPAVQGFVAQRGEGGLQAALAATALPPEGIEGMRLVGLVSGGPKPVAMLEVNGQPVTLRIGGQAGGWTLEAVESDEVLFRRDAERRRLCLGRKP